MLFGIVVDDEWWGSSLRRKKCYIIEKGKEVKRVIV